LEDRQIGALERMQATEPAIDVSQRSATLRAASAVVATPPSFLLHRNIE